MKGEPRGSSRTVTEDIVVGQSSVREGRLLITAMQIQPRGMRDKERWSFKMFLSTEINSKRQNRWRSYSRSDDAQGAYEKVNGRGIGRRVRGRKVGTRTLVGYD